MTAEEARSAAAALRRVVADIESGQLDADPGVPRLLLGAALGLEEASKLTATTNAD